MSAAFLEGAPRSGLEYPAGGQDEKVWIEANKVDRFKSGGSLEFARKMGLCQKYDVTYDFGNFC